MYNEKKKGVFAMTTFLGNPVTFTGSQLQVGDTAHDFSLTTPNLEKKSLADFAGKKKHPEVYSADAANMAERK